MISSRSSVCLKKIHVLVFKLMEGVKEGVITDLLVSQMKLVGTHEWLKFP